MIIFKCSLTKAYTLQKLPAAGYTDLAFDLPQRRLQTDLLFFGCKVQEWNKAL